MCPNLSTRLFHLAVFYSHANEIKRAADQNSIENLTNLMEDLRVRLDEEYTFTKEQMRNIRTQAQDTIYEAACTSFMMMHTDVLEHRIFLHWKPRIESPVGIKLNGVFGNPSREKALVSIVKKTCSSVRNFFRQDLHSSICEDTPSTLAQFTFASATKFKCGGPGLSLDVSFTIHNVLLRPFARENPSVTGVEEVEEDESTEDFGSSLAPAQKKRKITVTGRIPKGKINEFGGKNLQSAGWKEYMHKSIPAHCADGLQRYTNETIRADEYLFPSLEEIGRLGGSGTWYGDPCACEESMPEAGPSTASGARAGNSSMGGFGGSSRLLQHI
ncbi:hypothetical protein B0H13DRAFT_2286811 [Mycena leptocephala]|nr:hypothetical protein B0H13DRAFT_2286811 [Mycena leptocephala]